MSADNNDNEAINEEDLSAEGGLPAEESAPEEVRNADSAAVSSTASEVVIEEEDDEEDAGTAEILSYSLASLAGAFSNATIHKLPAILMLVLKINPVLVGLITALKVVWDAFTDPIMASVTDNCRSKWGRRRPFILVGGLMIPIVLIFGWLAMPKNEKMEPNVHYIPTSKDSEHHLGKFGQFLIGYGADDIEIVTGPVTGDKGLPETIDGTGEYHAGLVERAITRLQTPVIKFHKDKPAEEEVDSVDGSTDTGAQEEADHTEESTDVEKPVKPRLPLMVSITEMSQDIATYGDIFSEGSVQFVVNMQLGEDPVVRVPVSLKAVDKEGEDSSISAWLSDTMRGETERIDVTVDGMAYDYQKNIIAKRGVYRALVHGIEIALIETLGQHYSIPYWRNFEVFDRKKNVFTQPLTLVDGVDDIVREGFTADVEHVKELVYASGGITLDLSSDSYTEEERKLVDSYKSEHKQTTDEALHKHLWENLVVGRAIGTMKAYRDSLKPKKERTTTEKMFGWYFKIEKGLDAFMDGEAADKRIIIVSCIFLVFMATFHTIFGVPYYALGIEIAPSYDGRTKVVAIRSMLQKIVGFLVPWLLPICLLPVFDDAVDGAMYLSIVFAVISVPMVLASFFQTKERTQVDKRKKKVPALQSIKETISHGHFWRIAGLFFIVQKGLGIFNVVGMFVGVYYVFGGDLLLGNAYQALAGSFGVVLAFIAIPVIAWMCKHWEKHNAMRFSLIMMIIGCALKWWCYDPENPELMFIIPIFFSFGISAVYTVLSTMMADVTDADELINGSRREGMFGAVQALMMKITGAVGAIAAGVIVAASGFEVEKGIYQDPGVFTNMRLLFSFVPAIALSIGLAILWRYPLTRQRMKEIKVELKVQRARQKAEQDAEEKAEAAAAAAAE